MAVSPPAGDAATDHRLCAFVVAPSGRCTGSSGYAAGPIAGISPGGQSVGGHPERAVEVDARLYRQPLLVHRQRASSRGSVFGFRAFAARIELRPALAPVPEQIALSPAPLGLALSQHINGTRSISVTFAAGNRAFRARGPGAARINQRCNGRRPPTSAD